MKSIRSIYHRRNVAHARRALAEGRPLVLLREGQARCPRCGNGVRVTSTGRLYRHSDLDGYPCACAVQDETPVLDSLPDVDLQRSTYVPIRTPALPLAVPRALVAVEPQRTRQGDPLVIHAAFTDTPWRAQCGRPTGSVSSTLADVTCRQCRASKAYREWKASS